MNKPKDVLNNRASFVQKAIVNPKAAAKDLKLLALGLENCKTTSDSVEALKGILHISEATIFRDLKR